MRQRVLLVSYHFGEGSPTGGFRWTATVEHLLDEGFEFDVLTVARPGLAPTDTIGPARGRLEIFPVEQPQWPRTLLGTPATVAAKLLRPLRGRRGGGGDEAVPDSGPEGSGGGPTRRPEPLEPERWPVADPTSPRGLLRSLGKDLNELEACLMQTAWSRAATGVGLRLVRERAHGCVVVSSPPHYTQSVGAELHRRLGLPYVADFRDPFLYGLGTSMPLVSPLGQFLRARAERSWVPTQHTVVHNTAYAERVIGPLLQSYGRPRRVVVPNGYDVSAPDGRPRADRFQVCFAGCLHPFMDIRPVMAGLARLRDAHELAPEDFSLALMGVGETFEGLHLADLAAAYGIESSLEILPHGPRDRAWSLMAESAVLLAYDCIHPLAVPSKFYEHAQMWGHQLLIGNERGAMAEAAAEIDVAVRAPDDVDGVFRTLDEAYRTWRSGAFDGPADRGGLFAREHQSRRLGEILDAAMDGRTPAARADR